MPSWGLALDGTFDSPRTLLTSRGTITLQHYAVGLSVRRQLVSNLHATAGGRLVFLPASVADTSRLLISGAFFLTVDWRQPLIGPLFAVARIGTQARIQPEVLTVSGAPEFMVLPVWSFTAQAGLGLKL